MSRGEYVELTEEILRYRCPHYEELPGLGLYKDQVVCVLNQYVGVFYEEPDPVTATMVNNYVKMKVIDPPVRKKYSRDQMAHLYMVFLLKQVLSISEIAQLIALLLEHGTMEEAYGCLCRELEGALRATFGEREILSEGEAAKDRTPERELLRSALCSLAHKIYFVKMLPLAFEADATEQSEGEDESRGA